MSYDGNWRENFLERLDISRREILAFPDEARLNRCLRDPQMLLAHRPPSSNWEPLSLEPTGQLVVWVWFRPALVPYGMMFVIPPTAFVIPSFASMLSVRFLVAAAGVTEERIQFWSMYGMSFDAAGGTSPLLDQILTPPANGNLELSVWIEPPVQSYGVAPAMPDYSGAAGASAGAPLTEATGSSHQLLDAIEASWSSILQMETRVASLRKDLSSNISRLSSLNRDLSSDERRIADSKDIQAWTEARRWLRDALSTLSRSIKEIDVGTTSGAGQRHKFEEIYRKHVVPRIPFAGLGQAVNEFEIHHKRVQTVLASAQANIAKAGRDAEQRANAVLARIATKMRSTRR